MMLSSSYDDMMCDRMSKASVPPFPTAKRRVPTWAKANSEPPIKRVKRPMFRKEMTVTDEDVIIADESQHNKLLNLILEPLDEASVAMIATDFLRMLTVMTAEAAMNFVKIVIEITYTDVKADDVYLTAHKRVQFLKRIEQDLLQIEEYPLLQGFAHLSSKALCDNVGMFGRQLALAALPEAFLNQNYQTYVHSTLLKLVHHKSKSSRHLGSLLLCKMNTEILRYCVANPTAIETPTLQAHAVAIFKAVFAPGFTSVLCLLSPIIFGVFSDKVTEIRIAILSEVLIWLIDFPAIIMLDVILNRLRNTLHLSDVSTRVAALKLLNEILGFIEPPASDVLKHFVKLRHDTIVMATLEDDVDVALTAISICQKLLFIDTSFLRLNDHRLIVSNIFINKRSRAVIKAAAEFFMITFPVEFTSTYDEIRFFVHYFNSGHKYSPFNPVALINAFYHRFLALSRFKTMVNMLKYCQDGKVNSVAFRIVQLLAFIGRHLRKNSMDQTPEFKLLIETLLSDKTVGNNVSRSAENPPLVLLIRKFGCDMHSSKNEWHYLFTYIFMCFDVKNYDKYLNSTIKPYLKNLVAARVISIEKYRQLCN